MRIERREDGEYLIGGPTEVNDCNAERDGKTCNVHFDGQHMVTGHPDEDGSEYIVARWPIEATSRSSIDALVEKLTAVCALLDEHESANAATREDGSLVERALPLAREALSLAQAEQRARRVA